MPVIVASRCVLVISFDYVLYCKKRNLSLTRILSTESNFYGYDELLMANCSWEFVGRWNFVCLIFSWRDCWRFELSRILCQTTRRMWIWVRCKSGLHWMGLRSSDNGHHGANINYSYLSEDWAFILLLPVCICSCYVPSSLFLNQSHFASKDSLSALFEVEIRKTIVTSCCDNAKRYKDKNQFHL